MNEACMATSAKRSSDILSALDVIYTRRSVRSYRTQGLDRATIRGLIDAAVQAPTASHLEPWAFVVVQDRAMLKSYSDRARQVLADAVTVDPDAGTIVDPRAAQAVPAQLASPDFDVFYAAPVLIVICGRRGGAFVEADCWLAAANLMLAATAMGLGTCCIASALPVLTSPDVRRELLIPDSHEVVAAIAIGVPADGVEADSSRKEPHILSWN